MSQYTVRFPPELSEEILRLSKANNATPSKIIRELVRDGIIVRSEAATNSQFQCVEHRLRRMEDRFVAWLVKLTKATCQTWFFAEQLALFEVDDDDQVALREAAQSFMRQFLQQKTSRHRQETFEEHQPSMPE